MFIYINFFNNPGAENKSFIIINGGKNQIIKGTYVHELLIPHIASCFILL